jgi:hypothetical protein
MNASLLFDIKAEVFRRVTGHLAPGKDCAAGRNPSERAMEIAEGAWINWHRDYGPAVELTAEVAESFLQQ